MIYYDNSMNLMMIIGNIIILIGIVFYQINPIALFSITRKKIMFFYLEFNSDIKYDHFKQKLLL
jgi:hypothetical protein